MSGETIITVVGNLTGDPELKFLPNGSAVTNFTIASTPRTFDRDAQEWKDGDTLFLRCSIWRDAAENVAESLSRGTRVVAQGRLVQRSWETKEGEKRTVVELQVDEVGPSLRYATAQVRRTERTKGASQGATEPGPGWGGQQGQAQTGYGRPQQPDPWATQGPASRPGSYDEPPY